MRYRKMGDDGDYEFGARTSFLVNSPACVGQAVLTRLRLYAREWFLNLREGLDLNSILGTNTQRLRDFEVQQRILGTQGMRSITTYESTVEGRGFRVSATLDTIYGVTTINEVLQ